MIEPAQKDNALLNDIHATQLEKGEAAIWWMGQSGYAIKTASVLFYIDLYLSEHLTAKYAETEKPHIRMTRCPIRGKELRDVQWVFSSHKHSDHFDPGTLPDLFQANPDARLILPQALIDHASSLGLDKNRLIPTRGDETFQIGAMTVHSIPSAHPELDYTQEYGYPFLGYIFQIDGITLYHSGDTVVYEGLAQRLQQHSPDIAFLPINGTDAHRAALKVPPNMNMGEAIALARAIGQPLVIPHHYHMFTFNTADVREFERRATEVGLPCRILQCGEKFVWRR